MIYQDWKYREIHLFPMLFFFIATYKLVSPMWQMIFINLSFLAVQLVFLTLYFSIKEMKMVNLTQDYLGWGDILLLAAFSLFFHPVNFMIFMVAALIGSLLLHLFLNHKYKDQNGIPLVSYLGVFFALALLAEHSLSLNFSQLPILSL